MAGHPSTVMLGKRILPWIGSAAAHFLVVAVPAIFLGGLAPRTESVVLNIDIESPAGGRTTRAEPAVRTPQPPVPKAARAPDATAAAAEEKDQVPQEADPGVPSAAPTIQEEGVPAAAGPEIGWESTTRGILARGALSFPSMLSAIGQEVECEARITVTPQGMVSNVEITRKSGYTEIDAAVTAALRGYVFTRDPENKNAIGTVKFRFRLERSD